MQGRDVREVAAGIISKIVTDLRAEKNMRWCDELLSFSRAIRWLVALWGTALVPVEISGLAPGRTTYLQRTTTSTSQSRELPDGTPVGFHDVASADDLLPLLERGQIIVDTAQRPASVVEQAVALAEGVGGMIDIDNNEELIEEITNLVEDPVVVIGTFDERYLPVRNADGELMPYFVTMANGACDHDMVAAGNESVLRARYEDALFF